MVLVQHAQLSSSADQWGDLTTFVPFNESERETETLTNVSVKTPPFLNPSPASLHFPGPDFFSASSARI